MADVNVLFAQALSGLTNASFLFLMASGLSLIFGVLRILNFAHGSLYMVGAYATYQFVVWFGPGELAFWGAVILAATIVAVLGGLIERLLLRHLYSREELYQLLFTYALVLFFTDIVKVIWGVQQHSVSRPPSLSGAEVMLGATLPNYNLFIICWGRRSRCDVADPATDPCRAADPRGGARPRDARVARDQHQSALSRHLRGRLLPCRAGGRADHAGGDDRPGHGRRDHHRAVHHRGDRRPRLVLGHLPGRHHLRPGVLVRHSPDAALFAFRGRSLDGGGVDPPSDRAARGKSLR